MSRRKRRAREGKREKAHETMENDDVNSRVGQPEITSGAAAALRMEKASTKEAGKRKREKRRSNALGNADAGLFIHVHMHFVIVHRAMYRSVTDQCFRRFYF